MTCPHNILKCLTKFRPTTTWLLVGVALGALKVIPMINNWRKKERFQQSIKEFKQDVVYLYGFPRPTGGLNLSPPVIKVESFLRLAAIPYVYIATRDTTISPTERFPMIVHNGNIVSDSTFIVEYLVQAYNVKVDASLTAEQRAVGLGARRLLEANSSWCLYRSLVVDSTKAIVPFFAKEFGVARIVAKVMIYFVRKSMIKTLNTIGNGDLTDIQYRAEHLADVQALEALIGKNKYIVAEELTTYDCAVFNHLASTYYLIHSVEGLDRFPAMQFLQQSSLLRNYHDTILLQLFPDVQFITNDVSRKTRQEFTKK